MRDVGRLIEDLPAHTRRKTLCFLEGLSELRLALKQFLEEIRVDLEGRLTHFGRKKRRSGLHGFQRDAVEYAFHRLYAASDSTRRFLIADEVGLGKTLIARAFLPSQSSTFEIRSIGSTSSTSARTFGIAQQNINRLNPLLDTRFSDAERITLLPVQMESLANNPVNFAAFTPGTSLDLKGSLDATRARASLYVVGATLESQRGCPSQPAVQGGVTDLRSFSRERLRVPSQPDRISMRSPPRSFASWMLALSYDRTSRIFVQSSPVGGSSYLRTNAHGATHLSDTSAVYWLSTCIKALQPDLVILDEFQRFKSLLSNETEQGELARQLFEWSNHEDAAARKCFFSRRHRTRPTHFSTSSRKRITTRTSCEQSRF